MIALRALAAAPLAGLGLVLTVVGFAVGFAAMGVLEAARRIAGPT